MKVMPSTITTNILPKKKKKKKEKERGFLDVACTYSGSRISCKKVSILQFVEDSLDVACTYSGSRISCKKVSILQLVSCNSFFFFFYKIKFLI